MEKDLLKFENRSDDWLAKQRKEESRVSAWDFDEGIKVRNEHQDNCEARQIKTEHEIKHSMYKRMNKSGVRVNDKNKDATKLVIALGTMSFVLIFGVFFSVIASYEAYMGFIPLGIVIISLLLITGRKK